MARDLIVRKDERVVTFVHDEPGLKVETLVVFSDGLYARSDDGTFIIGQLTHALKEDLMVCDRCIVVLMQGFRVVRTSEARLLKEP
jgi:ABC-type Na+ transport system ATPase subunit NatA